MRPLPEHRPSWLSTILFALVVCIFALSLGTGFAHTWLEPVAEVTYDALVEIDSTRWINETNERGQKIMWIALGCGTAGATLAAFGWRASHETRFQVTYLSGLAFLVVTLGYTYNGASAATVYAFGGINASSDPGFEFISIPFVAMISTITGLVLILTALNLDRRR